MRDKAMKHLKELGAFEVPNPTLAKAVAMRRLMDEGASESDANKAVSMAFRRITLTTYAKNLKNDRFRESINFTVPAEWLAKILERAKWGTVETFLNEYTWDDTLPIRDEAEKDNVFQYERRKKDKVLNA